MNEEKHILTAADKITFLRIAGTLLLVAVKPLSVGFFLLYALTGLTDVLDGWIARKTKTASDFGARLDSAADLLFYAATLYCVFPALWKTLPRCIWYAVATVVLVRIAAYLTAAMKYRRFASMHTYMNKLTGGVVFLIPFLLATPYATPYCWGVFAVSLTASLEELILHLKNDIYHPDTKSIFLGSSE
ncbi:MAG: CDP-alcohol phosphatidyltransferase family protein [Faecousia sp.]